MFAEFPLLSSNRKFKMAYRSMNQNRFRNLLAVMPAIVVLQLVAPTVALGCPTCKEGLTNHAAVGYAISILLMMGMPFLLLSFWTITIVRLRHLAAQTNGGLKFSASHAHDSARRDSARS